MSNRHARKSIRATKKVQRTIPQLDAVRGLAILVVMFHNISPKYPLFRSDKLFSDGWMGVDLFFVLSGLLITGILLDTKQSAGYFKNFYVRRCLRIWPLYYSLLFFMFVGIRFLNSSEYYLVVQSSSPWWAFPLFLQNFCFQFRPMRLGLWALRGHSPSKNNSTRFGQ